MFARSKSAAFLLATTVSVAFGCSATPDDSASSDEDVTSSRVTIKGAIKYGEHVTAAFDGSKRHGYTFAGKQGAIIDLALAGPDADDTDTVVALYGPKTDAGFGSQPIATDDDGGGNLHSKLSAFSLSSDGEYMVAAICKNWFCKGRSYDLSLACTTGSCDAAVDPVRPTAAWTTLVYGSFDTHDDGGIPSSLGEMSQKLSKDNSNVNLLYLEDLPESGNTKLWKVTPRRTEVVKDFGELHLGRAETLTSVIKLVRQMYPSQHFFLDLIGHTNSGVAAFLPDYTGGGADWADQRMMFWQVRKAILDAGKPVDVLALSGCGTGDLEVVARLADTASYVVGLQEYGFGYTDVRWADSLARNSNIAPLGLARRVAEGEFKKGFFDQNQPGALGVYDTSKIGEVKTAFTALAQTLVSKEPTLGTQLASARKNAQEMKSEGFEFLVDAYDYAEQIEAATADADLKDKARAFRTSLGQLIVGGGTPNYADEETHGRAHGINLVFMRPGNTGRFSDPSDFDETSAWPVAETSFYEETGWRAFVTANYAKVQ